MGPAREIHAGSGYLSSDSPVEVMAVTEPASGFWVRWPGGKVIEGAVPTEATEILVGADGTIEPRG